MLRRIGRSSHLLRAQCMKACVSISCNQPKWNGYPNHHLQHNYMTAPLAVAGGMVASGFGTYWALRNHLNPIKARPLDQMMQARMVGEYLAGANLDIKLSPIDTAMQIEIR